MVESGGIVLCSLVAGVAVDSFLGVRAGFPLLHDARRGVRVTAQALLASCGDSWLLRVADRGKAERQQKSNPDAESHGGTSLEGKCSYPRSGRQLKKFYFFSKIFQIL